MKTAYLAQLTTDETVTGSAVLPFNNVVKKSDDIETATGGASIKALKTQSLSFNISIAGRNGEVLSASLLKNGDPFRTLATEVKQVNATVVDPGAAKGDEYAVQVGTAAPAAINSEPLYTSLTITG